MPLDLSALNNLPDAEKLRIVEMLWDDLGESKSPLPLPEWVNREVVRRREEMRDPSVGFTHAETWQRIANRHG